jgi:CRP-like cAMP-binding protein
MNSIIYHQGEKIRSVYVIMRGNFELSKKPNKKINHSIDVSLVSTG